MAEFLGLPACRMSNLSASRQPNLLLSRLLIKLASDDRKRVKRLVQDFEVSSLMFQVLAKLKG